MLESFQECLQLAKIVWSRTDKCSTKFPTITLLTIIYVRLPFGLESSSPSVNDWSCSVVRVDCKCK